MNVILNKTAGGGCAERNWELVKTHIFKRYNSIKVIDSNQTVSLESAIMDSIKSEDCNFIIAGGDGTINYFTNKLIEVLNEENIKKIKIGAVGIGSSNDFCKPYDIQNCIEKIPCKIDFNSTQAMDVGTIRYKSGVQLLKKYFLLNASVGVTAQANNFFNNPNRILNYLKRHFKGLAILYTAIRTILKFKGCEIQLIFDSNDTYSFCVSNLAIVKNPNISGNISFPVKADYQNGLFDIFLTHSMNRIELIRLLQSLTKNVFPKNDKSKHCRTSCLKLKAADNFLIEFDGEVITTNYAEFSILNKYLNVCVN